MRHVRRPRQQRGMNIVGQGGKIILFTLPSLIASTGPHLSAPDRGLA